MNTAAIDEEPVNLVPEDTGMFAAKYVGDKLARDIQQPERAGMVT